MNLEELFESWLKYLKYQKGFSDNTIIAYQADLVGFLSFISSYLDVVVTLASLNLVDIRLMRSWLAHRLRNKHSNRSNARALSAVKNFYKFCNTKFNLDCNVVLNIKTPKIPKYLPKALSA